MIREDLRCHPFLGIPKFTDVPLFDSNKMIAFRRQFYAETMAKINEAIIKQLSQMSRKTPLIAVMSKDENDQTLAENKETLILMRRVR